MALRRRLAAAAAELPPVVRGVALMLVAAFASATMNALVKDLAATIHAFEIAFFRSLFGVAVLVPALARAGLPSMRSAKLHLHALRGVLNAAAMLSFFFAVGITPLATVAALGFTSPLFATVLAGLLLRERIGPQRIIGLALGFGGVLLVLRPGLGPVGLGELLLVLSSCAWAAALVDIKVLSRTDSSLTITLYAGLFLIPITLLFALPVWVWPDRRELALLALLGALGSIGQLAVAQAFREADASQVMPADFTKLLWAVLIGYLAFGERPDLATLIGAALICAGVLYVVTAEARRRGG